MGFKWITSAGNVCSVPSEWENEPSVWQAALQFKPGVGQNPLGSGIPAGIVYNRAQNGYLGTFGFVFYEEVQSSETSADLPNSSTSAAEKELQNNSQYTSQRRLKCSCSGASQTCQLTSTSSSGTTSTYTNAYSYSSQNSNSQTNKVVNSLGVNAGLAANFKGVLTTFVPITGSASASPSWSSTKTSEVQDSTTISGNDYQKASNVTSKKTTFTVTCSVKLNCQPGDSYDILYSQYQGTWDVPWLGSYAFVLKGGATLDFVAGGTV